MKSSSFKRNVTLCLFLSATLLPAQTPPNTLSEEEEKAGYDLLFNGQDLGGWHGYRTPDRVPSDVWSVRTDAPLGTRLQNRNSHKQHLLSDKTYTNFDLKIDVMTPVGGNSGIFVRYEEVATSAENARSGPEMQVCGPQHYDCRNVEHSFGTCYDLFPVNASIRSSWYNTPGEWNQIRIVAYDSNYVHYGNGMKLLEYKIGTQAFLQAYNASKYASDGNNGRYYDIHPGSILLQDHSTDGQAFRSIKAKTLSAHPFTQEFPDGDWPEELDQEYVFGKRGCTDPGADNYDSDAEVDDGTCQEVSVNSRTEAELNAGLIRKGGEWKIHLSAPHTSAKLYSISGTEVALRQNGDESEYSMRGGIAPGLYVLQVQLEGNSATRMLMIP